MMAQAIILIYGIMNLDFDYNFEFNLKLNWNTMPIVHII